MNDKEYRDVIPAGRSSVYETEGKRETRPPLSPSAGAPRDNLSRYLESSLDFEGLAGDIKSLVTERIQNSMPDDRRLMLDLVSQMGALTDEVRLLRKQIENTIYQTSPVVDVSAELAEIKELIAHDPVYRSPEAGTEMPTAASTATPKKPATQESPAPPGPAVAPVEPTAVVTAAVQTEPKQEEPSKTMTDPKHPEEKQPKGKVKKKRTALSVIGNILFYVVIIGIVFGAFLVKSGSGGQPTMIAGYSAFTVLTSSMEDTYPKGSLIITQRTDADELEVGDDITYMVSETSSITHRIIGITENYLGTGERAFETQGTMNEKADKDPVAAANVVGKVIFCSAALGQMATFVSANWPILLFAVIVLCALFAFLKWNFKREDDESGRHAQRRRR